MRFSGTDDSHHWCAGDVIAIERTPAIALKVPVPYVVREITTGRYGDRQVVLAAESKTNLLGLPVAIIYRYDHGYRGKNLRVEKLKRNHSIAMHIE